MESADLDGRSNVCQRGCPNIFKRSELSDEGFERTIAIDVACVLGKDGEYEILDRINGLDCGGSKGFDQSVSDPYNLRVVFHCDASIDAKAPESNW